MNRTRIEYADHTWNPVTGCLRGCDYCYARDKTRIFGGSTADANTGNLHELYEPYMVQPKDPEKPPRVDPWPYGFDPTLVRYKLGRPARVKTGRRVFVCDMADLFGPWVPVEWRYATFETMERAPQHDYLVLTKFPENLPREIAGNVWAGATANDQEMTDHALGELTTVRGGLRWLSLEPLLGPVQLPDDAPIEWLVIGAQSKTTNCPAFQPKREWVRDLIAWARRNNVPCFLKDNLNWHTQMRQYPSGGVLF